MGTPFVFWLGNHPGSPGTAMDPADPTGRRSLIVTAPDLIRRVDQAPDELAKNRVFRDEALRYLRDDPLAFVPRFFRKLFYFWWFSPYGGRSYPAWQVAVYKGFYAVALLLAAVGLMAAATRRLRAAKSALTLVVIVPAVISLAQAVFYIDGRHRLAVEALVLVLTAAGIVAVSGGARDDV